MTHHSLLEDQTFEQAFHACTLDPKLFTHEAHVRLAWIHVLRYGPDVAKTNLYADIQRFDRVHGDGTKFHKTLTGAAVDVVWHFVQKSGSETFTEFIAEFPRLRTAFRELLAQHYSRERLFDPVASREFVEPDILPFS